jgi:hypothetical protein
MLIKMFSAFTLSLWTTKNSTEYPFSGEFSELRHSCSCGVLRDQGNASCSTPSNRVWILQGLISITMEDHSDLDTSLELEYESSQGSEAASSYEDELSQNLEPETQRIL